MEFPDDRFRDEELFPADREAEPAPPPSPRPIDESNGGQSFTTVTAEEEEEIAPFLPAQPQALADTGLSRAFLIDLALKTIHYAGLPAATRVTERMALPTGIVQEILAMLVDDHLCEIVSTSNTMTGNYRYRLTSTGMERVADALQRCRYAGPAPVTAEQYIEVAEQQRATRPPPSRQSIEEALSELVLAPEVADALARAFHSGRCTLLYGPSGDGKTFVLEALARHLEGVVLVPYAIYAQGQIIRVFDSSVHLPAHEARGQSLPSMDAGEAEDTSRRDQRWAVVRRPAVMAGGELGPESLELAYDPVSRFYQAPPHLKAQGGMLVVDDFGRQRIRPEDLLNRWLAPLERGWDSLAFQTGEKISMPFDVHLLFATNLRVELLLDQAFLRRILYKVEVPNPGPGEFREILRRACQDRGVMTSEEALGYVVQRLYDDGSLKPRGSYARDLLDIVVESAKYDNTEPAITPEAFEQAYRLFVPGRADSVAGAASS